MQRGGFHRSIRAVAVAGTLIVTCAGHLTAQGGDAAYPSLADLYLRGQIRDMDVDVFTGWDLMIFDWSVDRNPAYRENLSQIKSRKPDALFLLYHLAIGVNSSLSPPESLYTMADRYDWWLYDFEGNRLTDQSQWSFNKLLNFTNTDAADGSHPEGLRPNQFLPQNLIGQHIDVNPYWDGIFYDVFSDNIRWLSPDRKDATLNQVAEYDFQQNGDEPLFDNLWRAGMVSLAENTLALDPDVIMVANGLHRTATAYINGRMQENYTPSSKLSELASLQKYVVDTGRERPVSMLNAMARNENPTDYASMRYGLASALMLGTFFSCDFGSRDHAETLWFDEFVVEPGGGIAAYTTTLRGVVGGTELTIPVASTSEFPDHGVLWIDGEQIYYGAKTDSEFVQCYRGYPDYQGKYDLRRPHDDGATVIYYHNDATGWLGRPVSDAYDPADPAVKLRDLFAEAGWFANGEIADNIDSRVWRRDFEHGTVILNPTGESRTVAGMGEGTYRKIAGLQDAVHNDGKKVVDTLTVGSKDGYLLVKSIDQDPPSPPKGVTILE